MQTAPVPVRKEETKKKSTTGVLIVLIILTFAILSLLGVCIYGKLNGWFDQPSYEREENDAADGRDSEEEQDSETENVKETQTETVTGDTQTDDLAVNTPEDDTMKWGGNRVLGSSSSSDLHRYVIVEADVTWKEAFENSQSYTSGYLVHIDSQEEFDAIINLIEQEGYGSDSDETYFFWIGGRRYNVETDYYWVDVEGNRIEDILLFNNAADPAQTLSAREGILELTDTERFIYRLDLEDVNMMLSEDDINSWSFAKSENATLYLNFSDQIPALTGDSPSNLSNSELSVLIREKEAEQKDNVARFHRNRTSLLTSLAASLDSIDTYEDYTMERSSVEKNLRELEIYGTEEPIGFYYQYYVAEWHKKYVLSFACFCLTIVTFPLSFIKIRYGRLFGFGLSLLFAVAYWYILFFSQLKIFDVSFSSACLMWICDAVMLAFGIILLAVKRK